MRGDSLLLFQVGLGIILGFAVVRQVLVVLIRDILAGCGTIVLQDRAIGSDDIVPGAHVAFIFSIDAGVDRVRRRAALLLTGLLLGLAASYYQAGNPTERLIRALLIPPA